MSDIMIAKVCNVTGMEFPWYQWGIGDLGWVVVQCIYPDKLKSVSQSSVHSYRNVLEPCGILPTNTSL